MGDLSKAIEGLEAPRTTYEEAADALKERWVTLERWFNNLSVCAESSVKEKDKDGAAWYHLRLRRHNGKFQIEAARVGTPDEKSVQFQPVGKLPIKVMGRCVGLIHPLIESVHKITSDRVQEVLVDIRRFDDVMDAVGVTFDPASKEGA